jgi:hypothetical protein
MCVELTFYRWRGGGGVWLTNTSPRGSAIDVGLSETDLGEYTIVPGSAFKVANGSTISLGDYRFEYQE